MSNNIAAMLILGLVLFTSVTTGHVPSALSFIVPQGRETLRENNNDKTLRVASDELRSSDIAENDIKFEILVPEVKWVIPKNEPGLETPVKIGIRITNNQKVPVLFGLIDPLGELFLNVKDLEDKFLVYQGGRGGVFITSKTHPAQIHCSLLTSGQSLTFFLDAKLYWHNDKLMFGGSDGFGGIWYFEDIKPDSYQVSFSYINRRPIGTCPKNKEPLIVEGLWTGELRTPFVKIQVIQPSI